MMVVRECGVTAARVGVARLHRHLRPSPGALAGLELLRDGWPIGWAMVGRPVAPVLQAAGWVEVTRVAHDGTRNAGSCLYGACARWAAARGAPALTYTLPSESGASLRGAGWRVIGYTDPVRSPTRAGRPGRKRQPGRLDGIRKTKWAPAWVLEAGLAEEVAQ